MITLDMAQKSVPVVIPTSAFSTETGILTLQISLGAYSLTGKTVTAVFSKTGVETSPLTVTNGVIQLPIVAGYVLRGVNEIQLNIRTGLTLEQSPIMIWRILQPVSALDPDATDVDVITWLLNLSVDTVQRAEAAEATTGADAEATAEDRSAVNSALSTFSTVTLPAAIAEVEAEGDAQIILVQGEGTTQTGLVTAEGTTQVNRVIAEGDTQEQRVTGEGTTQVGLVQAEGVTQIGLVGEEGDAQILLVQGEGTTQIGLVQAEGATQVGIVEDEGDAQVLIVQNAGANLQSIIDNAQIGALDDLHTNDKATLVGAINEIYLQDISQAKRYGIRWDKVNAACTRLYDASAITTNTTNFGHFGSVNASYNNPFDNLYPWRDRNLVNVNVATYRAAIAAGTDVFASIVSWEGDPDFKLDGSNGFVGVYTPEFWFKIDNTASYVDYIISDMPLPGYTKFKATVGGRWHGVADGTGMTSKPGLPIANETMAAMHARASSVDMTLDDVWSYCATSLLASVEYATLNHQTAIGKGVDGVYVQSIRPYIDETGVNRVVMTDAQSSNFFTGVIIDIGTTDGALNIAHRIVTTVDAPSSHSAGYTSVNFDGATINTLSAHYVSAHGVSNLATPEILSTSGYIGTDGKANAYYRGQVHHANLWRYCLGAYRETLTSKIWTAVDPAGAAAVDALNTGVHRGTGLVLPTGAAGIALAGPLGGLLQGEIPLAPFGSAADGTDANPVGDYLYVPSLTTGNTVLRVGGIANLGLAAGRFCGSWGFDAGNLNWNIGALPFLKTP